MQIRHTDHLPRPFSNLLDSSPWMKPTISGNWTREEKKVTIHHAIGGRFTVVTRTWAPTSCRIISWITTSASVLKSWTNFLFLSSPVFSWTRSWKRGASCLHTRATLAAFSATCSSNLSRSAMPEEENGASLVNTEMETVSVREEEERWGHHTFTCWAKYTLEMKTGHFWKKTSMWVWDMTPKLNLKATHSSVQ